ncbi:hypothetical protein EJV47_12860 [Hymenobacter gummosus]|uniref:Uncharacterized protein n=1 Tax=Hymenobacter gummosus TaxID=1776032 RepID=A0A3S0JE43_9BACT|nr:hypothetical protein [Hymenobacter gummosus]RTQ49698.1 hypothetical protein EJV47_12860 [Hymenobacter gummosus]
MPAPTAFMAFSSALTGFSLVELFGTGVADTYYDALVHILSQATVDELLAAYEPGGEAGLPRLLAHPLYGPLARNVIKLWYTGSWEQLPPAVVLRLPVAPVDNVPRVISAETYLEGLMWKAIGAHPMGGKPLGYGVWAEAPAGHTH